MSRAKEATKVTALVVSCVGGVVAFAFFISWLATITAAGAVALCVSFIVIGLWLLVYSTI